MATISSTSASTSSFGAVTRVLTGLRLDSKNAAAPLPFGVPADACQSNNGENRVRMHWKTLRVTFHCGGSDDSADKFLPRRSLLSWLDVLRFWCPHVLHSWAG